MSDIDPRLQTLAGLYDVSMQTVRQTMRHVRATLGHDVDDETLVTQTMDLLLRQKRKEAVDAARRSVGR